MKYRNIIYSPNATLAEKHNLLMNDTVSYGILINFIAFVQFLMGVFAIELFNYTALKQVTRNIRGKKPMDEQFANEISKYVLLLTNFSM